MRKFNLILANAAIAATLLLSSCGNDDEDETKAEEVAGPSINFLNTEDKTVTPGSSLSFRLEIGKGDKNLDDLTVSRKVNAGASNPIGGTESGFTINETDKLVREAASASTDNPFSLPNSGGDYTVSVKAEAAEGTAVYTFTVKDKDGVTNSKSITITTENEKTTTDLPSAVDLTWKREAGTSASAATGFGSTGLKWSGNKTGFVIVAKDAATRFVKLTDSYSSITTVEDLKTKVDEATDVTSYDVETPGSLDVVLGAVSNGKYFLINLTNVSEEVVKNNDGSTKGTTTTITGTYKTEPSSNEEVKDGATKGDLQASK